MKHKVGIREARQKIGQLLNMVAAGDEVTILRYGKPVARLTKIQPKDQTLKFASRQKLRSKLPPSKTSSTKLLRIMRDERG